MQKRSQVAEPKQLPVHGQVWFQTFVMDGLRANNSRTTGSMKLLSAQPKNEIVEIEVSIRQHSTDATLQVTGTLMWTFVRKGVLPEYQAYAQRLVEAMRETIGKLDQLTESVGAEGASVEMLRQAPSALIVASGVVVMICRESSRHSVIAIP
jgi:hypothetical protein